MLLIVTTIDRFVMNAKINHNQNSTLLPKCWILINCMIYFSESIDGRVRMYNVVLNFDPSHRWNAYSVQLW